MPRHRTLRDPLVLAVAALLAGAGGLAHAAEGGFRQPVGPTAERRSSDNERGRILEPPRGGSERRQQDPERATPSTTFSHRGTRFHYSDGNWYRQDGNELVATRPPSGMMVRDLPEEHELRWVAGVPYFYARGLYYVWRERQRKYEVLQEAPAGIEVATKESASTNTPARPDPSGRP